MGQRHHFQSGFPRPPQHTQRRTPTIRHQNARQSDIFLHSSSLEQRGAMLAV
jgi:hypothetical protein